MAPARDANIGRKLHQSPGHCSVFFGFRRGYAQCCLPRLLDLFVRGGESDCAFCEKLITPGHPYRRFFGLLRDVLFCAMRTGGGVVRSCD